MPRRLSYGIAAAALVTLLVHASLLASGDAQLTVREGQAESELLDSERAVRGLLVEPSGASAGSPVLCGDVNNNGSISSSDIVGLVNYVFKSGAAPDCPDCHLASGAVSNAADVLNPGAGDWTVEWNASSSRYEITIVGTSFIYYNHHTSVTTISTSVKSMKTDSVGGKLLIYFFDASDNPIQSTFTFSVIQL